MSSYENVIGGKLKLKGKALDVKAGGMKKKKKKHSKAVSDKVSEVISNETLSGKLEFFFLYHTSTEPWLTSLISYC